MGVVLSLIAVPFIERGVWSHRIRKVSITPCPRRAVGGVRAREGLDCRGSGAFTDRRALQRGRCSHRIRKESITPCPRRAVAERWRLTLTNTALKSGTQYDNTRHTCQNKESVRVVWRARSGFHYNKSARVKRVKLGVCVPSAFIHSFILPHRGGRSGSGVSTNI